MKSAKDKLAHYRKQGFGDELIELLAMEEDDQELAEAVLDALILELDENNSVSENNTKNVSFEADEIIEVPAELFIPKSIQEQDFSELDGVEDLLLSEDLIKSAYERGKGVDYESVSENYGEAADEEWTEYIPPKLEVIEGGYEEDETIIGFVPEYALSEEEHEYALERSVAFFGEKTREDELSQFYEEPEENDFDCFDFDVIGRRSDEEWFVDEVEVAEIDAYEVYEDYEEVEAVEVSGELDILDEFDCFDLDGVARAAEKEIVESEVTILDLDGSRPAEKEWGEVVARPVREVAQITELVTLAENGVHEQQAINVKLQDELSNRDETIVVLGSEMERLGTIQQSMQMQLECESRKLASSVSTLAEYREEKLRAEHELLVFGNEIELLHGQLFNAQAVISEQSSTALAKEQVIARLSKGYDKLLKEQDVFITENSSLQREHDVEVSRANHELVLLGREIAKLKEQHAVLNGVIGKQNAAVFEKDKLIATLNSELGRAVDQRDELSKRVAELEAVTAKRERRIKRLERVRTKIKTLEFENNVLNTETVPNLHQDKEDLVELASEEYNRAEALDELAARRARRSSYTTTLAAAACLMLVLMPILSWNNIETEKADIKSNYSMQVAAIEADNVTLQQERDLLHKQLRSVNNKFESAKQAWSVQLSALQQEKANSINEGQVIQAAVNFDDSRYDAPALEIDSADVAIIPEETFAEAQYNGISGVEEYQQELASAIPEVELRQGKEVRVRSGEGLSQVLWRVYRSSTPQMVSYIADLNKLKKDRRGQPMLKINQSLKLPKDVNTAMARVNKKRKAL